MIITLAAFAFLLLLCFLIFLLPDFSKHSVNKAKNSRLPEGFVDFTSYCVTIYFVILIAFAGLLFYKFTVALSSYFLSDNLISFFVLLRGVFSVSNVVQSPFVWKHILSGLLFIPLFKFITVFLIYEGIRVFMNEINIFHKTEPTYTEKDVFYFGFVAIIIFIFIDIVFYSQNLPSVSEMSQYTFLILSNISVVAFFIAIAHISLLKYKTYNDSISRYIDMNQHAKKIVYSPYNTAFVTCIIATILHFPFYTGIQFAEKKYNIQIVAFLIFVCVLSYLLLTMVVRKGYNYFAVIMLVESPDELQNPSEILKPEVQKKLYYIIGGAFVLLFVIKYKLLFFIVTLITTSVFLLILLLIIIYISALFISLMRGRIFGYESPKVHIQPIKQYLSYATFAFIKGTYLMIITVFGVFVLISLFPKPINYTNKSFVNQIVDKNGITLFSVNNTDHPSIPVVYSDVPTFLIKCIVLQEDRAFFEQDGFFPNRSNWHGLSIASLYRFIFGGGGSNINQQLIKNMAFSDTFPQDIQRKYSESLSAYQLSIQCTPEEILTNYLNDVSFNGGFGHSGIVQASYATFNRPLRELNQIEMMYLVYTIKTAHKIKTDKGLIGFRDARYNSEEIEKVLRSKAEYWYNEKLLTKIEFQKIKKQSLRFAIPNDTYTGLVATKEFFRKNISAYDHPTTKYITSLSAKNQKKMILAVSEFKSAMHSNMRKNGFNLYSAALVVDVHTGKIIAHYGGEGVTDLASFDNGNPVGSVIKPFLLIELLEGGRNFNDVKLYDGVLHGRRTPENSSHHYSNTYVGINKILGSSLNAPMVNIREFVNPIELFNNVENRFSVMEIHPDRYLDLSNQSKHGEYEDNYPIGSRNVTVFDLAQLYQTLFNGGEYRQLTLLSSYYSPDSGHAVDLPQKYSRVYRKANADAIKQALTYTMQPGGTGTSIKRLLPEGKVFYAKTGTSDKAIHGYTVLSDGNILIVAWVSYGQNNNGRLEFNTAQEIPFGSGAKSAGLLAGMIYKHLL